MYVKIMASQSWDVFETQCIQNTVHGHLISFWLQSDYLLYPAITVDQKTRLLAIMNLIAKLGIIYTTACHASLCTTPLDCLNVSCHCHRTGITTIYKHGTGRGGGDYWVKLPLQLALCKVLCWLPLTAIRNTPFLSSSDRQSYTLCCTLVSIWHLSTGWSKHSQPPLPPPGNRRRLPIHPAAPLPAQWPT